MAYYDIGEVFQRIEEDMIASMSRNLKRHIKTEKEEGLNYTMWQAEQLAALNEFKRNNSSLFSSYFSTINDQIEEVLKKAHASGKMEQEEEILKAIREGWSTALKSQDMLQGAFFRINERKLNALIDSVKNDMQKAETAMLRMANDEYRKIVFNSQAYYNTGAGTLPQCVDMATKDFLSKWITCIEYANGARVGIDVYSRMAIRTAQTRAYLLGESVKRDEWGINTVIVNKRGVACPKCLQYVGKVFYDDVWGSSPVPSPAKYPRLSEAISGGLYHPNCKDIHTTYFEGVSTKPKPMTKEQIAEANRVYDLEQRQRYYERTIRKYKRLYNGSTDPENAVKYKEKLHYWQGVQDEFIKANSDVLKRRPELEKVFSLPDNLQYGHNLYDPAQDIDNIIGNEGHVHAWIETVIKQPKCEEPGEKIIKCSICGEEKTEEIPALGHDMKPHVTAPTCTKEGFTLWVCDRKGCLHSYKTDIKPALGHDYGDWVITRQPTATEYGRKQRICKRCGKVSYSTIPKLKGGAATAQSAGTAPKATMAVPERAWGKKHADAMRNIMDKAPPEAQRVWAKYEKKIHVYDPHYTGDDAHYHPRYKGIKMDIAKDARNRASESAYRTAFHEFGHNIDYVAGEAKNKWFGRAISETYKNKQGFTLGQMVKRDWQDRITEYMLQNNKTVRDAAERDLISKIKRSLSLKQRFDISDMIEGATTQIIDYPLGAGHGHDYWNGRDNGKEAFAEMYSAMVAEPESLEQIKKYFPNAYNTFLEILGGIS